MGRQKEDLDYDFLVAWKTGDKDWVKQRRSIWKYVQIQLDRIRYSSVLYSYLPKKNYKFLKSYFLTGRDKPETIKREELVNCLKGYDSQFEADLLLQFWLSADHSKEYLDFLKEFLELEFDERKKAFSRENWEKEKLDRTLIYEKSAEAYRYTVLIYTGIEHYKWSGETNDYNGPIFGELEPEMLSLFTLTSRQKEHLDKRVAGEGGTGIYRGGFENVLTGYFGSEQVKNYACFNPHNPIKNMLDEYERWGVPAKRRDKKDRRPFLASTALAWHVVNTPDGRHPVQVEVAKELKQRILDVRKKVPNEAKERIGNAIKLYETGKFKNFL